MKFCLVTAATTNGITDREVLADYTGQEPPLGVLCVAGVLEQIDIPTQIVDFDWWYADWFKTRGGKGSDLAAEAARELAAIDADCFGFSSICSSYPLTVRTAKLLKDRRPEVRILFGGPQATAVAEETLAEFPFVDVVVRGEAENIVPLLVEALSGSRELSSVPGISYRANDHVMRNADAAVVRDLDSLPLPPFHLYPHLKKCRSLPLELGRGCPFTCTFCSTSTFFRRQYRLKSPPAVIQQMMQTRRQFGFSTFHFIHDNYTVDRRRVVAFCEALRDCGAKFRWTCSARLDCVDDQLLRVMKSAGCEGIFFGLEVGTDRMQQIVGKRLDLDRAAAVIRQVNRRKMASAVALMFGFPDETPEDMRATVQVFMDTLRYDYIAPQISILAPLAGTPLHLLHKDELVFDGIVSDLAFQGREQETWEKQMVAAHASVFSSFYGIPTRWLSRHFLQELRNFLLHGEAHFRWLLVGAHQAVGDILELFRLWREWRVRYTRADPGVHLVEYYRGPEFRREFIQFVRTELAHRCAGAAYVLKALADYQTALEQDPPEKSRKKQSTRTFADKNAHPVRCPEIRMVEVEVDYREVIRRLRRRGRLDRVPRRKTTVIARRRRGRVEILQLSPISAELLRLSDGTRSVRKLARKFSRYHETVKGIPGEKACIAALELLRLQGFLMAGTASAAVH